ncbi:MAG: hypothetical protein L3J17_04030 [Candidatus Jettenia sp.]|nr:MAG: hypothetical protein L3J17_04030 [Candidatus Jettenia sp.]
MQKSSSFYLPKKARACLECLREQIIENHYTPKLSSLLDSIDHILDCTERQQGGANDE